ncbi:MAG: hypothetical protein WCE84_02775 [Candidatus Rhabdochlamydia sp.]
MVKQISKTRSASLATAGIKVDGSVRQQPLQVFILSWTFSLSITSGFSVLFQNMYFAFSLVVGDICSETLFQ